MHLIFEGQIEGLTLYALDIGAYLMGSIRVAGMIWIAGPHIVEYDDGIQGYCILAESHTSIHINKYGYTFLDLFSCKAFNTRAVMDYAEDALALRIETWDTLYRGLEFLDLVDPLPIPI